MEAVLRPASRYVLLGVLGVLLLLPASGEAQDEIGDFFFVHNPGTLGQADRSHISTDAVGTTFSVQPSLLWRCSERALEEGLTLTTMEMALLVDGLETSDGHVTVQWRFQGDPPSSPSRWPVTGSDPVVAFVPDPERNAFTHRASSAGEVFVRVVDERGTFDSQFGLAEFSRALDRLSCRTALPDAEAPGAEAESRDGLPDPVEELRDPPFTTPPELHNRGEVTRAMAREYPRPLREAGVGGTIRVYVFVDTDGSVLESRVEVSSGLRELDDAALAVADVMRFSPALHDGEPVGTWVSFPVRFRVR